MKARLAKFATLLAKWEALKLAFALGAVCGMVLQAALMVLAMQGLTIWEALS